MSASYAGKWSRSFFFFLFSSFFLFFFFFLFLFFSFLYFVHVIYFRRWETRGRQGTTNCRPTLARLHIILHSKKIRGWDDNYVKKRRERKGSSRCSEHSINIFRRWGRSSLLLTLALFLLIKLSLLLGSCLLVLLILGHEIVHVALSLSKLHVVHTLTSIPMQERLASKHRGELFRYPLE